MAPLLGITMNLIHPLTFKMNMFSKIKALTTQSRTPLFIFSTRVGHDSVCQNNLELEDKYRCKCNNIALLIVTKSKYEHLYQSRKYGQKRQYNNAWEQTQRCHDQKKSIWNFDNINNEMRIRASTKKNPQENGKRERV